MFRIFEFKKKRGVNLGQTISKRLQGYKISKQKKKALTTIVRTPVR
jgi:hypothetical protein